MPIKNNEDVQLLVALQKRLCEIQSSVEILSQENTISEDAVPNSPPMNRIPPTAIQEREALENCLQKLSISVRQAFIHQYVQMQPGIYMLKPFSDFLTLEQSAIEVFIEKNSVDANAQSSVPSAENASFLCSTSRTHPFTAAVSSELTSDPGTDLMILRGLQATIKVVIAPSRDVNIWLSFKPQFEKLSPNAKKRFREAFLVSEEHSYHFRGNEAKNFAEKTEAELNAFANNVSAASVTSSSSDPSFVHLTTDLLTQPLLK